ncbi:hypothetical protein [Aestuariirhabdus sp. LZHN29]|uniref:hypothetical protein n=1 Tax=Aestuariirhabdus sp. LZHN29 TaxID=3417462 RepID=UPI003CEDD107
MTQSVMSAILEIDQLVGSVERLQRQQIDTVDTYNRGFRDGRNELANYTLKTLSGIRMELMSLHLRHCSKICAETEKGSA